VKLPSAGFRVSGIGPDDMVSGGTFEKIFNKMGEIIKDGGRIGGVKLVFQQ
jgi:hypothetical protein